MKSNMKATNEALQRLFRTQHGVLARRQAAEAGATRHFISARLGDGSWIRCGPGVYRLAGAPRTAEQRIKAAVLLAGDGAAASHRSAAHLWDLLEAGSALPTVTVPRFRHPRPHGYRLIRSSDLRPGCIRVRRGIDCTDPLRTIVDLCTVADPVVIHEAIDRAVASRLLTVDGMIEAARRLARPGRQGPAVLLGLLQGRGMTGVVVPSVLESRFLRLLHRHGITPEGIEVVVGPEQQYRVDAVVAPGVVVEVDGYRYHWSPEAKDRDDRRRNQLLLDGQVVLVFTWSDVSAHPDRVVSDIRAALAARGR